MSNESTYGTPLPTADLFQDSMRRLNLQYAHAALVYILRRPDNDLQAPIAESMLRRHRSVNPEYLVVFYENFSGLIGAIQRYISLEESCTKSGAYRKDLAVVFARLQRILAEFEHSDNARTHQYLEGMMR